jgi:hypothetical protein
MAKIFISYRREDSKHAVGRLYAALKRHVRDPKRDIFIDIDNIPRGVDFVEHLDGQVAQCDVLLAVIGPSWLDIRNPATGQRRLDDAGDFVRIEIASALKRGIPVVPVMLDETPVPAAADLPDDLKALSRRNGERLQHESFESDVARLIRGLPDTSKGRAMAAPRSGSTSWGVVVPLVGVMAVAGLGLGTVLIDPFGWRQAEDVVTTEPVAVTPDARGTVQVGAEPSADPSRILRGGTWYTDDTVFRSASRLSMSSSNTLRGIGFRVARTL